MPKDEGDEKGKDHSISLSSVTKKPSRSAPMPKDEGDEKGKDHPISLSSVTRKPSHSAPMPKDEGDDKRDDHLLSLKPTEQTTVVISSVQPRMILIYGYLILIYTNVIKLFWNPLNGSMMELYMLHRTCCRHRPMHGKIAGWQSIQFSKREGLFAVVPPHSLFVQLLHTGNCHWVNVNVHGGGCYKDTISVYDSRQPNTVSCDITRSICSFYKCKSDVLRLDIMNVISQPNANDCGVHAIAYRIAGNFRRLKISDKVENLLRINFRILNFRTLGICVRTYIHARARAMAGHASCLSAYNYTRVHVYIHTTCIYCVLILA